MELHIVIEGRRDLAGQLYRQLSDAIHSGRLAAGEQMPPSRLLSEQLGVSRKTVSEAYSRLVLDKLLVGQVGVGTFVRDLPMLKPVKQTAANLAGAEVVRRWSGIDTPLRHPAPEGQSRYEFIGGNASKVPFPAEEWRRCISRALRQESEIRGRYAPTEGLLDLRRAVAGFAGFTRGVRCSEHDIVITNGAQQALDLISRVLLEPGAVVAVEEPGYPPARELFASQGAKIISIPVDDQGMVVDAIPVGCRLIYTTPAHQFPLGLPMSQQRRQALLARAFAIGAIIVEDDYDSAFRYEGRPADCLQGMDTQGIVAYVGTFSKVMLPEVRVGYLVVPPALMEAVQKAKYLTDCHNATLLQLALAIFIKDGHLQRHIRRCHTIYAARRDKLLNWFAGDLAPWLEPVPFNAGFHMTALLRVPMEIDLVLRTARRVEVGLYSIECFYHDTPSQNGLFFGFGAIDTIDIDVALGRVKDVLTQLS